METTLLEIFTSESHMKVIKTGRLLKEEELVETVKGEVLELFDSVVPKTKAVVDYEDVYLLIPSVDETESFAGKTITIEINPVTLTCNSGSDLKVFKLSARVGK